MFTASMHSYTTTQMSRPLSILRPSHHGFGTSLSGSTCSRPARILHRYAASFGTSSTQSGVLETARASGPPPPKASAPTEDVNGAQTDANAPPTRRKLTPNEMEHKVKKAILLRQLRKEHRSELESETDTPVDPVPPDVARAVLKTISRVRPDLLPVRTTTFSTLNPEALRESDWVDLSGRYAFQFNYDPDGKDGPRTLSYVPRPRWIDLMDEVNHQFPAYTQGFFYLAFPAGGDASPLTAELRFRLTDSSDPGSWAYGKDLIGKDGILPWSISVLGMLGRYRPHFAAILNLLLREKVLDRDDLAAMRFAYMRRKDSEIIRPSSRPIIAGRPFVWRPNAPPPAVAWVVGHRAMGVVEFEHVLESVYHRKLMKARVRALLCLEPVGDAASVDGEFVLRCLQIFQHVPPRQRAVLEDVSPLASFTFKGSENVVYEVATGELISTHGKPVKLTATRLEAARLTRI